MVQELYRIQWRDETGLWRYVSGEILSKIEPDSSAILIKDKPYVFTKRAHAERIARALTDWKNVVKVELREERTILSMDGAGK